MDTRARHPGRQALAIGLTFLAAAVSAEAEPACLVVASEPAGAKILVDGYYKGRTPKLVSIASAVAAPRVYRVTVLLPEYPRQTTEVPLAAGESKVVRYRWPADMVAVCIDPGHPSETSDGTRAKDGTTEVHLNWQVAERLRDELLGRSYRVVMTKTAEAQRVTNRERAEIANKAGVAGLLRLHCDHAGSRGWTVYYPAKAATKDGVTGPSEGVIEGSRRLAEALDAALRVRLEGHLRANGIKTDADTYIGSRQGALTGSIYSRVPVVTVEMMFMSSEHDVAFLRSAAGQRRMAAALADGIAAFAPATALPEPEVRSAGRE